MLVAVAFCKRNKCSLKLKQTVCASTQHHMDHRQRNASAAQYHTNQCTDGQLYSRVSQNDALPVRTGSMNDDA